jgi:EAL domain-containing protein (putative c-di-GMP-specific phosphodiesterase class I)
LPLEFALPIYRAAHRQSDVTSTIGLRQPRSQRNRRLTMSEDLARPESLAAAIELDQLRLFYHPIVDLAGTTVVGHEVLIRWQHPEYGLLGPAEFLPAIDRDPLLSRTLGGWILHQSCAAAMQRAEQLHVSVNISPLHLAEPGFADHVTQILRATGFSPTGLILEITEASVVTPNPVVTETCIALDELGVTLALDDYGIGTVDSNRLVTLPLGVLKIDRAVVGQVGSDPAAELTVCNAVGLAAANGWRTIAVGVESHHQARFLREHDVTFAQGYLYGRPQPR